MAETVTVLCVDDRDDAETFDHHFAKDEASRREDDDDAPRRLVRTGQVVRSDRTARAALLRAANDHAVPDIVLIDHMLRGDGSEKYVPRSLELMCWIRDELGRRGEQLPACVLWTTRFDPGLAFTFVRCGGMQAIDRMIDWQDQIDAMWQAYDWCVRGHGEWTHKPADGWPALTVAPSSAELLPYLEADASTVEIMRGLDISEGAVSDRRRVLVQAMNQQIPAHLLPGGQPIVVNGRSSSLAQIARNGGLVWVPLAYAAYIDAG